MTKEERAGFRRYITAKNDLPIEDWFDLTNEKFISASDVKAFLKHKYGNAFHQRVSEYNYEEMKAFNKYYRTLIGGAVDFSNMTQADIKDHFVKKYHISVLSMPEKNRIKSADTTSYNTYVDHNPKYPMLYAEDFADFELDYLKSTGFYLGVNVEDLKLSDKNIQKAAKSDFSFSEDPLLFKHTEDTLDDGKNVFDVFDQRKQPEFVFRGDMRRPELIFEKGLTAKSNSLDVVDASSNRDSNNGGIKMRFNSGFVSTSKSFWKANQFAKVNSNLKNVDGYVYIIRNPGDGIDVNDYYKNRSLPWPSSGEVEIAIPKYISPEHIQGAKLPDGTFIKNKRYKGR